MMKLIRQHSTGFYRHNVNDHNVQAQAGELASLIKKEPVFNWEDPGHHQMFRLLIQLLMTGGEDPVFEWTELCDQLITLLANSKSKRIDVNIPIALQRLSRLKEFFSDFEDDPSAKFMLQYQALNIHPDCAKVHKIAINHYRRITGAATYKGISDCSVQELIDKIREHQGSLPDWYNQPSPL